MRIKAASLSILLLMIPLACSGCAAFRSGDIENIAPWPPSQTLSNKQKLTFKINMDTNQRAEWITATLRAYTASGMFSSVTEGEPSDGLHAEITFSGQHSTFFGSTELTAYTLFLIPCGVSNTFTMQTTFYDNQGRILGAVEKSATATLWFHLFMVFFYPFRQPDQTWTLTLYDVNRATLVEAKAKGYI
jgi:hypothetical protein